MLQLPVQWIKSNMRCIETCLKKNFSHSFPPIKSNMRCIETNFFTFHNVSIIDKE